MFEKNKKKNNPVLKLKSALVWLVLSSLILQMFPSPVHAIDFKGFLDKVLKKIQIPNEFEFTEQGGIKLGGGTKNYLSINNKPIFDCLFKQKADKSIKFCGCDIKTLKCGFNSNPACEALSGSDKCVSPFSVFTLGEWQTDLKKETSLGEGLAIPDVKYPQECELKIPLPDDDFAVSLEEKSAHQAACNYFISLESAAAQEVFAVKKIFNGTDPLSDCFFLKNCKSNCSLRFGEVRYDITVLDILKFIVPGGALTYIQQIMSVVSAIQKVVKIASAFKTLLVDGSKVLNDAYEIIKNFSAFASSWQNLGLKWKDVLSVMAGPIGIAANRERLSKGYDGFIGLIQNFSNNMIEYSGAKVQALQAADQSVKDLINIVSDGKTDPNDPSKRLVAGFKNESEIGFLFASDSSSSNYKKRQEFDSMIKEYQNVFVSLGGLLHNIAAVGDLVGSQSVAERRNLNDGCEDWFDTFCSCQSKDKCGDLIKGTNFAKANTPSSLEEFWKDHQEMTFIDFLQQHKNLEQDLNKGIVIKCERCWNNFAFCENKYCSEGIQPDTSEAEARFTPFNANDPNGKSINWLTAMKTAFTELNKMENIFNAFDVDYTQAKINESLGFISEFTDPDKGLNSPVDIYTMDKLDYSKAPWRVFWEDLTMAVHGLSPIEFYDSTNQNSQFYWQGGDMEGRHKQAMLSTIALFPSAELFAHFDETYESLNYKFDEGDYQSKAACGLDFCPLSYTFNPITKKWSIKNVSVCSFVLPKQIKNCLADIRVKLLEVTALNPSLTNQWFTDISAATEDLKSAKADRISKCPTCKDDQELFWAQWGPCEQNDSACLALWNSIFDSSYKEELAETPDLSERISLLDLSVPLLFQIKDALINYNLSPENSVLIYYIFKAQNGFQELNDKSSDKNYEKQIDDIMKKLSCGTATGGIISDCQDACDDLVEIKGACKDLCSSNGDRAAGVSYRECRDACDLVDPQKTEGQTNWQQTVEQFVQSNPSLPFPTFNQKNQSYSACRDYCRDTKNCPSSGNCYPGKCADACYEAADACFSNYCLTLSVTNSVCDDLKDLKTKFQAFFSKDDFTTYSNQAKDRLRKIQDDWEKPVASGNEAVIARSYLEKILTLILNSQDLVAVNQQDLCSKNDNPKYKSSYLASNLPTPLPKIKDLMKDVEDNIIDVLKNIAQDPQASSAKTEIDNFIKILEEPVNTVNKNIIEEIDQKIGTEYWDTCDRNPSRKDFLNRINCFEKDNNQRTTCQLLSFLDVMDTLFQSQENMAETKEAIGLLEPKIKMEFAQQDPNKALEMMKNDPLWKFPFWETSASGEIKIAGVPIKGFADFKKAVDLNPVVFLSGLYEAIKNNLADTENELISARTLVDYNDVFGGESRAPVYRDAILNFMEQNLTDVKRRVFGDKDLAPACKLISPILQSDPREVIEQCEARSATPANPALESQCADLLRADLSVLQQKPQDVQDEIDRLKEQRKNVGLTGIECPKECPSNATCQAAANCKTDKQYRLAANCLTCYKGNKINGDYCWPPKDEEGNFVDGYQAAAEFCDSTDLRLKELEGATSLLEVCKVVGYTATCDNQEDNLFNIKAEVDALMNDCNELEQQKAIDRECDYISMLQDKVFHNKCFVSECCGIPSCSSGENTNFDNGADPTTCKDRCKEARSSLKPALCYQLTGEKILAQCTIPDLTLQGFGSDENPDCAKMGTDFEDELSGRDKELCNLLAARDKAINACTLGAGSVKEPLDEVMKIFSILIGIRSATKLYNGVQSLVGDVKQVSDAFSNLKKAIQETSKDIEASWDAIDNESGSGGLTISPLKCNAHPADSYSELRQAKISGPNGGPVCPDISDFFAQVEAQFGLVRNNLRQIDLARKDIEENYLALPFNLNIHLFDKKEVVFPSINNLHDTASAIKQKAQFVWALAFAVNFSAKNCTCGESYCKMPLCISGLPLAFGPISNASCYLTWALRYPMLKIAESLEDDLEAIE